MGILEAIQFSHIAYFGASLSPSALLLLAHERCDIFDVAYIRHVWFVYPLLALIYGMGALLFIKGESTKRTRPLLSVFMVFYALSLLMTDGLTLRPKRLMKVIRSQPDWFLHRHCMRTPAPSLKATLLTCACALSGQLLPQKVFAKNYQPYTLTKSPSNAQNIVLIMGESLNCDHLSLFGYARETTPYLKTLKQEPFFFYKPAYAAAPNTKTSITLFFNLVREPDNLHPLQTGIYNLFRRARANGFKTFLITNNDGSRSMGPDIDVIYTSVLLDNAPHASYPTQLRVIKDRAFASLLKELPLSEKNFIVLHMRAPHSPYETAYQNDNRQQFEKFPVAGISSDQRLVNTYDNCVLYLDTVLHEMVESFKVTFRERGESYLFFTADHGELFGEQDPHTGAKMYGHGHLTLSTMRVPFWLFALQKPPLSLTKKLNSSPLLSAYDMGQLILACLGEKLYNPQEQPDIGYASSGLMGENLSYQKMPDGTARLIIPQEIQK